MPSAGFGRSLTPNVFITDIPPAQMTPEMRIQLGIDHTNRVVGIGENQLRTQGPLLANPKLPHTFNFVGPYATIPPNMWGGTLESTAYLASKLVRLTRVGGKYLTFEIIDRKANELFTFNMHRVEAKKVARAITDLIDAASDTDRLIEGVMLGPSPTADQLIENQKQKTDEL